MARSPLLWLLAIAQCLLPTHAADGFVNGVFGTFNGHTYYAATAPSDATYWTSKAFAASACHLGDCNGYIAYIETTAENDFVFSLAAQIKDDDEAPFVWLGNTGFLDGYYRSWCGDANKQFNHPKCVGDRCCADNDGAIGCNGTFECSWEPGKPEQCDGRDCIIGLDKRGAGAGRKLGEWFNIQCDANLGLQYVYVVEYDEDPRTTTSTTTSTSSTSSTSSTTPTSSISPNSSSSTSRINLTSSSTSASNTSTSAASLSSVSRLLLDLFYTTVMLPLLH